MCGLRLDLETDGAAGGEPYFVTYAFILRDPTTNAVVGQQHGVVADEDATHNDGEWTAVIEGMKKALELGATMLVIRSDSELVVKQFTGRCRVRNRRLAALHLEAMRLKGKFTGDVIAI